MPKSAATVRCAIYTRKSTEEGLDQEFNSLDAQREAAEAYIASQQHFARGPGVIDGPFAETKELIAGFWLWQVKSMEEAIDWLKPCPNPHNEDGEGENP